MVSIPPLPAEPASLPSTTSRPPSRPTRTPDQPAHRPPARTVAWHEPHRHRAAPVQQRDEPIPENARRDLRHRGLEPGMLARSATAAARLSCASTADGSMPRGRAWLPMHWGEQFMNGYGANALMPSATDPYSFQPELKHRRRHREAELPWSLAVVPGLRRRSDPLALTWPARTFSKRCLCHGRPLRQRRALVLLRRCSAACRNCSPTSMPCSRWPAGRAFMPIPRRGVDKRAIAARWPSAAHAPRPAKTGDGLAGRDAMADDAIDAALIRYALAPIATPPKETGAGPLRRSSAMRRRHRGADRQGAGGGASLNALQDTLKCGTFCGGCLPDLKKMVAAKEAVPA